MPHTDISSAWRAMLDEFRQYREECSATLSKVFQKLDTRGTATGEGYRVVELPVVKGTNADDLISLPVEAALRLADEGGGWCEVGLMVLLGQARSRPREARVQRVMIRKVSDGWLLKMDGWSTSLEANPSDADAARVAADIESQVAAYYRTSFDRWYSGVLK